MILDTIMKAFLTACGAGILTMIIVMLKWIKKKMSIDDMTIKALAHDAYFRHCRYLLPEDEITEEELENHNYLYDAYHGQGLNGTGDRMHELILEKKVKVALSKGTVHKLP